MDTGWFIGPDNQWRFEISDKDALLLGEIKNFPKDRNILISKVLKHE